MILFVYPIYNFNYSYNHIPVFKRKPQSVECLSSKYSAAWVGHYSDYGIHSLTLPEFGVYAYQQVAITLPQLLPASCACS